MCVTTDNGNKRSSGGGAISVKDSCMGRARESSLLGIKEQVKRGRRWDIYAARSKAEGYHLVPEFRS